MRAPELLAELDRRGVEVRADGDQIRYRPGSKVSTELREALHTQRDQVLAELRSREDPLELEVADHTQVRQEPTGYLLHSRLLEREVWICRDDRAAKEIAAESPGTPVLTFDEVPLLKGKSVEWLHAVLDVKATFVGAKVQA